MNEYVAMWKNYFNFHGRTSVRGYWMAVLFNLVIAIVLSLLGMFADIFSFVSGLYGLAIMIPSIALAVRRLHDTNRSGFWYFLNLIPCVGSIILIIWFCQASVEDNNRFGTEQF